MTRPRLGNCVIINNVSSSMPGSEHDVTALNEAFQTVGFEVHVCRDCNDKVTMDTLEVVYTEIKDLVW